MSVVTAHKILIATAIGFFLVYALWELVEYTHAGDPRALAWSMGGTAAAVGLAVYLRRFIRAHAAAPRAGAAKSGHA